MNFGKKKSIQKYFCSKDDEKERILGEGMVLETKAVFWIQLKGV